MTLPVTVVLPTLNCRHQLARHLDTIADWLGDAAAIVSVDSRSDDGTAELLDERLTPYGATLLSTPPGLYESWNAAIAQANTRWTYVSTVGDTIDRRGLLDLLAAAETLDADVVVSPPLMLAEDGSTPSDTRWPIHAICEAMGSGAEAQLLSACETVMALCSYVTGSILGSSAGNLYRTAFVQTHPFPVEFGHAGDTAWGLQNCARVRLAVLPKPVSKFCLGWQFRESDPRDQRELFFRLYREAGSALDQAIAEGNEELRIAKGWLEALVQNKAVLWDWLAAQAGLVEQHEKLRAYLDQVEAEKARSLRARVKRLLGR